MTYRSSIVPRASLGTALAVAASVLPMSTLATRSSHAQDSIKFGVLEPFTGPWAKNGNESYVAMEIARDMINEQGGVQGKKVAFVRGDAPDPSAGKSEAERIITQEGVKLITGTYASPLGIAISAEAERHGVIHWETIASADIITKRGYKHVFQVGPAASRYGKAALDFTKDELAKRLDKKLEDLRIALLWENRAFGTAVAVGVRAQAKELGVKLIYDEGYDQFMTDMTPLVQKLKDAKPEVLIVISFINDTILLHRKAKELNFYVPAVIGVSAGHSVPDLKDSLGTAVNGMFVSDLPVLVNPTALRPDVQAAAVEFNKRYESVQRRVPAGHAVASFAALLDPVQGRAAEGKVDGPRGCACGGAVDGPAGREFDQRQRIEILQFRSAGGPEGRGPEYPLVDRRVGMAGSRRAAGLPESLATNDVTMVPLPQWSKR